MQQDFEISFIRVNVSQYYDHPEYYRYMPTSVFEALETAYINGSLTANVPNEEFTRMIILKQINETPQLQ